MHEKEYIYSDGDDDKSFQELFLMVINNLLPVSFYK